MEAFGEAEIQNVSIPICAFSKLPRRPAGFTLNGYATHSKHFCLLPNNGSNAIGLAEDENKQKPPKSSEN